MGQWMDACTLRRSAFIGRSGGGLFAIFVVDVVLVVVMMCCFNVARAAIEWSLSNIFRKYSFFQTSPSIFDRSPP